MRLQGKTAPITGGSSIELATARLFAAEGVVRSGRLFLLEMTDQGGSQRRRLAETPHSVASPRREIVFYHA